jgi:hypothetical protein
MGKIFQAPNGEKLEARDEVQEVAFKNAGLVEVKEDKKK